MKEICEGGVESHQSLSCEMGRKVATDIATLRCQWGLVSEPFVSKLCQVQINQTQFGLKNSSAIPASTWEQFRPLKNVENFVNQLTSSLYISNDQSLELT